MTDHAIPARPFRKAHSTRPRSPGGTRRASSKLPALKPVLIVLHQEHSTPGRVGRLLQARGHALDIRKPRYGDPLPQTMQGHAGAVIFGGPMGANDPDDFVKAEIDWIGTCLKEDAPFLGICLGAQMMASRRLRLPHRRGMPRHRRRFPGSGDQGGAALLWHPVPPRGDTSDDVPLGCARP